MVKRVTDDLLEDDTADLSSAGGNEPALENDDEDLELEASDDADEPEDDPEPAGEPEAEDDDADIDPEPEPAPRTRGQRQHAELRRRAQAAERALAEKDARARELEAQLAQARQPVAPVESAAVREARLAAMDPIERTEFLINELRADNARDRQMQQFQAADTSDRTAYDTLAQINPVYRKYKDEVEHRLRLLRNAGQNVPRETVLKFLIGEKVVSARASNKPNPKRAEAAARVRKQTVTPARARGEGGSSKREADSVARMRRLENLQI